MTSRERGAAYLVWAGIVIGFAIEILSFGCAAIDPHSLGHTLSNWRVETQMYEVEWLNGLPAGHGHLADGEPYETWK